MMPLSSPRSTRMWRPWRSPWTSATEELGSSSSASARMRSAALRLAGARSVSASSRSRVIRTRNGMSARRFGSTGSTRSASTSALVAGAWSALRKRPISTPRRVRSASVRLASAGSTPPSIRCPKNGLGKSSLSLPINAGIGMGMGTSGASRGSTASSRETRGTASARRGKRNAHSPSTSQTELSKPSPTRRTARASSCANCSARSARTSASSMSTSGSHSATARTYPLACR